MESKMGCLKGNNVRKNIKGGEDDGKGGHDRERVPAAFIMLTSASTDVTH